jgi:hypothetical protein
VARLGLLLLALSCGSPSAQEAQPGDIGYPTVAAALEALKAKPGTTLRMQGGWTIVNDPGESAVWSFTPPGHAAYPAAIKRYVFQKDGAMMVRMTALCQAEKSACDRLIEEFKELNERAGRQMREKKEGKPAAWAPSEEQKARAAETLRRFLDAIDGKRYEEAYAMLSSRMRGMMSFEQFKELDEDLDRKSGGEPKRSGTRVTWYKDPPRAVAPGVYAAFDMQCSYRKIDRCSELVILHAEDGQEFVVLRHERTVVDKDKR